MQSDEKIGKETQRTANKGGVIVAQPHFKLKKDKKV